MLSIKPVSFCAGQRYESADKKNPTRGYDTLNIERKLEETYVEHKKKGGRIIPAVIASAVGFVLGAKLGKIADNRILNKLYNKAAEMTKPVTDSAAAFIKKHIPKPKITNEKVIGVLDFVKGGIKAFAKLGDETSFAKGLFKSSLTTAGGLFGLKVGFTDKDGDGVSDLQEKFITTDNTVGTVLEVCGAVEVI